MAMFGGWNESLILPLPRHLALSMERLLCALLSQCMAG